MTVRRLPLVLVVVGALALVLALPSMAFANAAVHGSYDMNTDACAGCHRAHTAASPITWVNTAGDPRSALLITTAADIEAFCYTCHGTDMTGADTNVYDGIYEADESGEDAYNFFGEALNGGGFNPELYPTIHYPNNTTWVAYGAGPDGRNGIISTGGEEVEISCTVCHDTHGSSNYRLLKDQVAGINPLTGARDAVVVGGYDAAGVPDPWVISAEEGYPVNGWLLHEMGQEQVVGYFPDYTTPRYAKAPNSDVARGMSAWCATCHTQMNTRGDSGVVSDTDPTDDASTDVDYLAQWYDANDLFGYVERHRHPVNVELSTYLGPRALSTTSTVPVANGSIADVGSRDTTDWIDCMTCHVGHGSNALMTGFAAVADTSDPLQDSSYGVTPGDGLGSVPPDDGNALLRDSAHLGGNDRFVCESCHNK